MKSLTILSLAFFLCSSALFGQAGKVYIDYLSVPGPINMDGKTYHFSWSAHPSATYYKQEYLTKGDNSEKFTSMVMLEVLTGDVKVKDIVAAKIAELKKIKETNPVVNYDVFQKDGEYILDFLITANAADGGIDILERNVYRYKTLAAKSGQQGLILFAVSERAYGKNVNSFLINLKKTKSKLVDAVAKYPIPSISIKK